MYLLGTKTKKTKPYHHHIFWYFLAQCISEVRQDSQEQKEEGIFSAHSLEHEAYLNFLLRWLRRKYRRTDSAVLLSASCSGHTQLSLFCSSETTAEHGQTT